MERPVFVPRFVSKVVHSNDFLHNVADLSQFEGHLKLIQDGGWKHLSMIARHQNMLWSVLKKSSEAASICILSHPKSCLEHTETWNLPAFPHFHPRFQGNHPSHGWLSQPIQGHRRHFSKSRAPFGAPQGSSASIYHINDPFSNHIYHHPIPIIPIHSPVEQGPQAHTPVVASLGGPASCCLWAARQEGKPPWLGPEKTKRCHNMGIMIYDAHENI